MTAPCARINDPEAVRLVREQFHDLRQPLAAINALASAALAQDGVPESATACLSEICEQVGLLLAMCRRVLEDPPIESPVPMHVLAHEIAASFRWSHGAEVHVEAEPVLVVTDPVELRRAVTNLVDNAVRVSRPEGTVRISVRVDGMTVWVEVADSGPGFGEGAPGTASLGLSIVERLASRHGGCLDVAVGPAGGTAVRFSLAAASCDEGGSLGVETARAAG